MKETAAIILAAGKGTRMKSQKAKVLHEIAGKPIVGWVLDAVKNAGASKNLLVVGHQSETVIDYVFKKYEIDIVEQSEQLGTGHAVKLACEKLVGFDGVVLICCGDTPLIKPETLSKLVKFHTLNKNSVTILTAVLDNPTGYGRIVRDSKGDVIQIVEQKDANLQQLEISEINSGIYCVDAPFLLSAVKKISCDNAQGEYYLTDIVSIAVAENAGCQGEAAADCDEIMGVNDRFQLSEAAKIIQQRINKELMLSGVSIIDPNSTYIDSSVNIEPDVTIYPNSYIRGESNISSGTVVEPSVIIDSCKIAANCRIKAGSVLEESEIYEDVSVGPMAHLRPGTVLKSHVKIGNFVETKKAVMNEGAKASHLTYLGDAEIGKNVNIGCGTITCNYDGVNKHRTVIEDDVFIGSDVQLVAPVTVGRNSLVAAGTTVTKDVPPDSLALSRVPQLNKDGWRIKDKK